MNKKLHLAFLLLLVITNASYAQFPDFMNNLNMNRESIWKKSAEETVINVCWEDKQGYEFERAWVKESVEEVWSSVANIRFAGWGQCNNNSDGVRIQVVDGNPRVRAFGKRISGVVNGMKLNFTFKNFSIGNHSKLEGIKFTAVHEFGHALGITHEMNRPDCQCEETQSMDGGYYVTPCDINSVMNYCNPVWNNGGRLSKYDKAGIQAIYGKRIGSDEIGVLQIRDEMGKGQVWENVYVNIGGVDITLHIDSESPVDVKYFKIGNDGIYSYKVVSVTKDAEGREYKGYGEGKLKMTTVDKFGVKVYGEYLGDYKYKLSLRP